MVLVVVLCVLEVVMYLVRTCVHLLIVKVDVLGHVVQMRVPEKQAMIVTVCVMAVVIIVLVAEEIVTLVV